MGSAVFVKDNASVFKGAIVKRVFPEGGVGVYCGEEFAGFLDLVEGCTCSSHLKGFANKVDVFGIWHPAVIFTLLTCARIDGDHRLTLKPTRRDAWNGSLGDNGA